MDKNNGIIITLSIIFGGLFAWIMPRPNLLKQSFY